VVCQELASLASEVGMDLFKERLSILNKAKQSWIESDVSGNMLLVTYIYNYIKSYTYVCVVNIVVISYNVM